MSKPYQPQGMIGERSDEHDITTKIFLVSRTGMLIVRSSTV